MCTDFDRLAAPAWEYAQAWHEFVMEPERGCDRSVMVRLRPWREH